MKLVDYGDVDVVCGCETTTASTATTIETHWGFVVDFGDEKTDRENTLISDFPIFQLFTARHSELIKDHSDPNLNCRWG